MGWDALHSNQAQNKAIGPVDIPRYNVMHIDELFGEILRRSSSTIHERRKKGARGASAKILSVCSHGLSLPAGSQLYQPFHNVACGV